MLYSLEAIVLHLAILAALMCPFTLLVDRTVFAEAFEDPVTDHMAAVAASTAIMLIMVTAIPWHDDLPALTGIVATGLVITAYVVGRFERSGQRYNPYRQLLERLARRRVIENDIDRLRA